MNMVFAELLDSTEAVITRKDAASVLGCDPRKVSKAVKAGDIPSISIAGRDYILREPFVAMLKGEKWGSGHGI